MNNELYSITKYVSCRCISIDGLVKINGINTLTAATATTKPTMVSNRDLYDLFTILI